MSNLPNDAFAGYSSLEVKSFVDNETVTGSDTFAFVEVEITQQAGIILSSLENSLPTISAVGYPPEKLISQIGNNDMRFILSVIINQLAKS